MANSKQLQLRARVATVIAAVAGGNVQQNREFNLPNNVASQVHVNFRSSQPEAVTMYVDHPVDWSTLIEIVILTRAGTVEASDAADALWVEIFGLVMADQSLGGLAAYLVPGGAEVDDAEADTSLCRLNWSIAVQHRTSNNSISS